MTDRAPLTIQETMLALGVSEKTVRRLLKRGELEEHSRLLNRVLITAESIERVASQSGRPPAEPVQGATVMQAMPQPSELQQVSATFADLLREKDERIYALQRQVADLEAQQKYLPSLTDIERAELDRLRQEIESLRAPSPSSRPVTGTGSEQGVRAWIRRKTGF